MSEARLKVGVRVEVIGKDSIGTIAYIGTTQFSTGKWIGVALDEPKGKNDGTVQGKRYFTCTEGHGLFVRPTQLKLEGEPGSMSSSMLASDTSIYSESDASPRKTQTGKPATPRTGSTSSLNSTGKPTAQTRRPASKSGAESMRKKPSAAAPVSPPNKGERLSPSKVQPPKSSPRQQKPSITPSEAPAQPPTLAEVQPPTEEPIAPPAESVTVPAVDVPASLPSAPASLPSLPDQVSEPIYKPPKTPSTVLTSKLPQTPSSASPPSMVPPSPAPSSAHRRDSRPAEGSDLELTNLRAEVARLTEALGNLRHKREEDKARLQDYEHLKMQVTQLEENGRLMREQAADHQRAMAQFKAEKSELQAAFDRYKDEVSEAMENHELVTLDKEMAEAKLEDTQAEIEQMKEKVEELTLENQILKEEAEVSGQPSADGGPTPQQLRALEQQNERMKEALIKLRDLNNQDKQEMAKVNKEISRLESEVSLLTSDKQRVTSELQQTVEESIELKDQIDASLGVDQMVSQLSQRNLDLEETLEKLKEEYHDMEALCEMNDEIQENSREMERELREELEMAINANNQLGRHLEASKSTSADYERTLVKFRDLVNNLQAQNADLKRANMEAGRPADLSVTIDKPVFDESPTHLLPSADSQTKTMAKLLDSELRRMEADQSNLHASRISTFLPESFLRRGADNDALLSVLMIERLGAKADLLARHLSERYPVPACIPTHSKAPSTAAALASSSGDQPQSPKRPSGPTSELPLSKAKSEFYAFVTRLVYLLRAYSSMLTECQTVLSQCSVELYLKLGSLRHEIADHEPALDRLIDLLKQDRLDESVSLDPLNASLVYFAQLQAVHLSSAADQLTGDCSSQLANFTAYSQAASDALATGATALNLLSGQSMAPLEKASIDSAAAIGGPLSSPTASSQPPTKADGVNDALVRLLVDLVACATLIRIKARRIKRRLPVDREAQPLSFGRNIANNLDRMRTFMTLIGSTLYNATRSAGQLTARQEDESKNLSTATVLNDCLTNAYKQALASQGPVSSPDRTPEQGLRAWLKQIETGLLKLAESVENGEFDFDGTKQVKTQDPISIRAEAFRQAQAELESSRVKVELKEEEVKEFKATLKSKATELSEMSVRVGLAEKRLENAGKGSEDKITRLELRLEQMEANQQHQVREHEQAIASLQHDIDTVDADRAKLKEKLNAMSKQALFDTLSKQPLAPDSALKSSIEAAKSGSAAAPSELKDTNLMTQEIGALREALRFMSSEKSKLAGEKMRMQLKSLTPLKKPAHRRLRAPAEGFSSGEGEKQQQAERPSLMALTTKLADLQKSVYNVMAHPPLVALPKPESDVSHQTATRQYMNSLSHLLTLKNQYQQLERQTVEALKADVPSAFIKTDFTAFPSASIRSKLAKATAEEQPCDGALLGRLVFRDKTSAASSPDDSKAAKILMQSNELKQLQCHLFQS